MAASQLSSAPIRGTATIIYLVTPSPIGDAVRPPCADDQVSSPRVKFVAPGRPVRRPVVQLVLPVVSDGVLSPFLVLRSWVLQVSVLLFPLPS